MTASDTHTVDWTSVAAGWSANRHRVEEMKTDVSRRILAHLDIRPGDHVLELGAGTGEFARVLAEATGPDGHVLATDVAEGMVELIRETTADLPQVSVARVDAADTGLPDGGFDAVAFRMGLMLVTEPAAALAEIHRVLKPGGRFAAATWAAPEFNPWLTSVGMAAMVNGLVSGGPPVGPGGVFSLTDPQRLEELAAAAGLRDVAVEAVDLRVDFASTEAYVDHVTSMAPPIAAALSTATPEQHAAFRTTVGQLVDGYRDGDGLAIPARALLLTATR